MEWVVDGGLVDCGGVVRCSELSRVTFWELGGGLVGDRGGRE